MESVSSIPTLFLVVAGIFVVSIALLVIVLWLGRRWLVGPLRQLSRDVEQLKEAERQPSPPSKTVVAPQEIIAPEVFNDPEPMLIGLSNTQDSGSYIPPGAHPEDAAIETSSEGAQIIKRSDSSPLATIAKLTLDDVYEMCCLIHDQVKMSIGEISLKAVLFDTQAERIEIAYPAEENEQASCPAESQRLWSIVHTGQAQQETTQSGGSWLGVPICTGNEVLGALVIQKPQLTSGFEEPVQHLLSNLAAQVAIILRSRRQAEGTRIQAEQSQSLSSLTRKIWTSSDQDVILRTALEEVGRSLHASSGWIQLEYSKANSSVNGAAA